MAFASQEEGGEGLLRPTTERRAGNRLREGTLATREIRDCAICLCIIAAIWLVPGVYRFIFAALALWALLGPVQALHAISISWLLVAVSPAVVPDKTAADALRWLVLAGVIGRAALRALVMKSDVPPQLGPLGAFVSVVAVESMFASYAPDVSILKIVVFGLSVAAVLVVMTELRTRQVAATSWLVGLSAAVVLSGFPLLGSESGYLLNSRGFQGILSHPQTLGVFSGILVVWLATTWVAEKRLSAFLVLVLALATVELVYSQARTGVLAASGALVGGAVLRAGRGVVARRALVAMLAVGTVVVASLALSARLRGDVLSLLVKYDSGESIQSALLVSRGELIAREWDNFLRSPVVGIGFGLPSDENDLVVLRDDWFGIPVGAASEKGVVVVALLEEVGLVGTAAFGWLAWTIVRGVRRTKSPIPTGLVGVIALINCGEAVLFSVGGTGLFVWIIGLYGIVTLRERRQSSTVNLRPPRSRDWLSAA